MYFYGVNEDYEIPLKLFEESIRHMMTVIHFPVNNNGKIEQKLIEEHFNCDFLEQKYGGNLKDLEEFWPPRCLEDATKTLDENSLNFNNIIPFTYNDAEFKSYSFDSINSIQNSKKSRRMSKINYFTKFFKVMEVIKN